jgi:hypothetical protein
MYLKLPHNIDEKFITVLKSYCVGAIQNSPWNFTNPKIYDCVYFLDPKMYLTIRSNFRLQEWMVGSELFSKSKNIKSHFNFCVSGKCGGETVIIDINGYGEINDFVLSGSVPEEIQFYVEICDILRNKILHFEKNLLLLAYKYTLETTILESK